MYRITDESWDLESLLYDANDPLDILEGLENITKRRKPGELDEAAHMPVTDPPKTPGVPGVLGRKKCVYPS